MTKLLIEFETKDECEAFMGGVEFCDPGDVRITDNHDLWCVIVTDQQEDNVTYTWRDGQLIFKHLGVEI